MYSSQHRSADLFLAALLACITFSVAYPAAMALGKVLLQTAPERGVVGGRMEAFLRVMRDVCLVLHFFRSRLKSFFFQLERHPQILHLPPPHVWQLTPSSATNFNSTMVATLELHVSKDLDDESVLNVTKWAWERCMTALGANIKEQGLRNADTAEVTVGVVRD